MLSHLQIPGFLLLEKHVGSCNLSVYKPSIPIFARIIRRNVFFLRARSDFSGALYKDRALTTCLSCGSCPSSWSVTSTSCGFGSCIVFCSIACAQLPLRLVPRPQNVQNGQKAYSTRIMPQLYFLLLTPYCARNSAGRVCKGL